VASLLERDPPQLDFLVLVGFGCRPPDGFHVDAPLVHDLPAQLPLPFIIPQPRLGTTQN
jgi:hypothetical protein